MNCKIPLLTIILSVSSLCAFAQQGEEAWRMADVFPEKAPPVYALKDVKGEGSFFSGLFVFYKQFLSSQDGQSCTFSPSCSEYGLIAVKKLGPIKGVLSTLDRLSRCNGISPEKYRYDPQKKLLIDEVGDE